MSHMDHIIKLAFGVCFALALTLIARGQQISEVGGFSGGTVSGVILGPNGTSSAPAYSFSSSPGSGMYVSGTATAFTNSGVLLGYFNSAAGRLIITPNSGGVDLQTNSSSLRLGGSSDTILGWGAAATLQLGDTDAASPIAQRIQPQSVVAGNANTAGATFTIAGSKSNGSGGGDVVLQTTLANAASGTQNTLATALTMKGGTQAVVTAAAIADSGFDYQTPATGATVTIPSGSYHEIIDPAGTLATLTINMPTAPINGQYVDVRLSQVITALTVSGNGNSIKGNPTSAAVGSQFSCFFRTANTTWYC